MNIREKLLKEHSKENALRIAAFASSSAYNFNELMTCFLANEYRVAQRAAWSVSLVARTNPALILPHLKVLVNVLSSTNVHDAVIRNSIRILEDMDVPKEFHGEVMNACFNYIETPRSPIAIKAFSLTTLHKLSKFYAEIKPELKLLIEERWDTETAAFKSRGRKILQVLK